MIYRKFVLDAYALSMACFSCRCLCTSNRRHLRVGAHQFEVDVRVQVYQPCINDANESIFADKEKPTRLMLTFPCCQDRSQWACSCPKNGTGQQISCLSCHWGMAVRGLFAHARTTCVSSVTTNKNLRRNSSTLPLQKRKAHLGFPRGIGLFFSSDSLSGCGSGPPCPLVRISPFNAGKMTGQI